MEKLPTKKKLHIVKQYLCGLSYDEIAAKTGVSKGTVANVIADLKAGRFPEAADVGEYIELLRELSLDLKRLNIALGQCATGLAVLTRINECGLDPADMERWPLILQEAGTGDEVPEFVRMIYGIQEVRNRTGLSLEDLHDKVHELEKRAADLEPMSKQYGDYQKQLAELSQRRENLASAVAPLEQKYGLLNPRVKDLEKREQDISGRLKDMESRGKKAETAIATLAGEKQQLLSIGLSVAARAEFNQKLQSVARRHRIKPANLRDRLLQELEHLDEGLTLEALVTSRQLEVEKQEQATASAKKESHSLETVVAGLQQEKAGLEASIKETREKVSQELGKIPMLARDTITRVAEVLRRGNAEALAQVRQLQVEAIEMGKRMGRWEEMLHANQWLSDLLALARGEQGIEAKQDYRNVGSPGRQRLVEGPG